MPHASRIVAVGRPLRVRCDLTTPVGYKADRSQDECTATSQAPPSLKCHRPVFRGMDVIRNEAGANGTIAETNRTVAGTKTIRRAHVTSSALAGVAALTPSENNQAHSLNDSYPPGILAH
jgi:hypothetical protein